MPLSGETTVKELFIRACQRNDLNIIRNLLPVGADVNWREEGGDLRPGLHLAVNEEHEEVVDLLLAKGADPNCTDRDGRSCLHLGCCSGHPETVSRLLRAGADPNIFDKHR